MRAQAERYDTETHCHCGARYHGSDHCPVCGCEQYETGDCGHEASQEEHGCSWLIRVASGNPEPDFPEDLWMEVECAADLTINEYGSWCCTAGHEYVTYDDPARGAWDAEQAFIERQEERY